MKKIATASALLLILITAGCRTSDTDIISADKAKETVTSGYPGAVITDCEFDEDENLYKIEFETEYGEYEAFVSAKNGSIISVTLEEEPIAPSDYESEDEDEKPKQIYSPDDALSIALMDADLSGSVLTVKNQYDSDTNCYNLIFRSGNKEFSYRIDAETGAIKDSSVDMDS